MTQDEIIELAEQAGMTQDGDMWFSFGKGDMDVEHKHLVAFAHLVAAKERDACAEPQRSWIGLTDDEFNELYDRYVPLTCYAVLIEKVESKLKEKNGFAEDFSVTEQNICLKCRSFFCDHTCKTNPEENT
jgi:hypothetical protein